MNVEFEPCRKLERPLSRGDYMEAFLRGGSGADHSGELLLGVGSDEQESSYGVGRAIMQ